MPNSFSSSASASVTSSARASMADLIAKVRLLIADPAGDAQTFTDLQIQDALDQRRTTAKLLQLRGEPTITDDGSFTYRDYYSRLGDWDSSGTLQGASWATLTPSASEWLVGH